MRILVIARLRRRDCHTVDNQVTHIQRGDTGSRGHHRARRSHQRRGVLGVIPGCQPRALEVARGGRADHDRRLDFRLQRISAALHALAQTGACAEIGGRGRQIAEADLDIAAVLRQQADTLGIAAGIHRHHASGVADEVDCLDHGSP